jgi:hypothetical protein
MTEMYSTELALAAACAAHRLNGGEYVKIQWPADTPGKPTNRSLVKSLLTVKGIDRILPEDYALGKEVRRNFRSVTFKVIQGFPVSEFESHALKLVDPDEMDLTLSLGLLCSLPCVYVRNSIANNAKTRIAFATGGYILRPGEKTTLDIEVISIFYSKNWETFYVSGITTEDQAVFFSYKKRLDIGSKVKIYGTIKCHRENQTQLNRVKVMSDE